MRKHELFIAMRKKQRDIDDTFRSECLLLRLYIYSKPFFTK